MLKTCPRCKYKGLEERESYTICYECNWTPPENNHCQLLADEPYYYPLSIDLEKQLKEIEKELSKKIIHFPIETSSKTLRYLSKKKRA